MGLTGLGQGDQGRKRETETEGGDVCVGTRIPKGCRSREHTCEAIGFCSGRTDNEVRLIASSESVSRHLEQT